MNDLNTDNGDSAESKTEMHFYCVNCGKQFATMDEAHTHWKETRDAPINDIILPILPGKPMKPLGTTHDGMW